MGKRTKLILGIIAVVLVIGSGTIFALAKTGVIHIKFLADQAGTNFWVEVRDSNNADLPVGTTVYAVLPGYANGLGVSVQTQQKTGIDGYGRQTTKNVAIFSLAANTLYNFSTNCSAGGFSTQAQVNTNSYYGSNFFDPFVFTPVCSGCPTGQHYDPSQGKCVLDTPPPTSTLFGLRGEIYKDSVNASNYIGGATVTIVDKTKPTPPLATATSTSYPFTGGSFHYNFQTSNFVLPNNSYSNIYIDISVAGRQPVDMPLSGYIAGNSSDGSETFDQVKPIVLPTSTGKIDIQGIIKGDDGKPMAGVIANVSCTTTPSTAFEACKPKLNDPNYPYAYSRVESDVQKTHSNSQNYFISGVYDFKAETSFDNITLNTQPPDNSYYYDKNGDGKQGSDELVGSAHIPIKNSEIKYDTAGSNGYVAEKDIVFRKVVTSGVTTITGKVTDKNGKPIPNNVGVYARTGGFPTNFSPNQPTDFKPYQFNAVTDSAGNYKITIEPQQISGSLQLGICAMVEKLPNDINHRNWGCYENGTNKFLAVNSGQSYPNINITISSYILNADFSTFNLIGHSGVIPEQGGLSESAEVSCDKCNKGPWQLDYQNPSDSDPLTTDYQIKNIYNIAQQGSIVNSLKISITSGDTAQWYFDTNNNYIKDDPEVIEIKPSEITANSYIGADGKLYLKKDLNIRNIIQAKTEFVVAGKFYASDTGTLLTASYGDINVEYDPLKLSSGVKESKDNLFFPASKPVANYVTEPMYLYSGSTYHIKVIPIKGDWSAPKYQLSDPSDADITITTKDIKYDNILKLYVYIKNIPMSHYGGKTKVQFNSIVTGQPVNLETSKIQSTTFECERKDGSLIKNCLLNYRLLSASEDPTRSIVEYSIDQQITDWGGRFSVFLDTVDGQYGEGFFPVSIKTAKVFLKPQKASFADKYYCEQIIGVKFCTFKGEKDIFFTTENRALMLKQAQIVVAFFLAAKAKLPAFLLTNNQEASGGEWTEGPLDGLGQLNISMEYLKNIDTHMLLHESSHIIEGYLSEKEKVDYRSALAAARNGHCDAHYFQYKCFSNYSVNNPNDRELWAEFAAWWVSDNDNIKKALADPNMSAPCKNSLKYLYQFMIEKFPGLKSYRQKLTTSSLPNEVALDTNTNGKVLGASTDNNLSTILAQYGYEETSTDPISTIAPLSNLTLTPDQIASGVWLQANYAVLPPKQKLQLQLNVLTTTATNTIAAAGRTMATVIANLDTKITNLLVNLGLHITTASISGNVQDQDGPLAGMKVNFGSKVAVTDSLGKYTLSRVPSGTFNLTVSDPKINKIYKTTSYSIADDQHNDNTNILINRPSYSFKGQIYQGSATLNNGKLLIDGKQTINLDATGKFNFKLKQGQHTIVIKNKNNKVMSVGNSGTFGNLAKLNVVNNFDSLIWVK